MLKMSAQFVTHLFGDGDHALDDEGIVRRIGIEHVGIDAFHDQLHLQGSNKRLLPIGTELDKLLNKRFYFACHLSLPTLRMERKRHATSLRFTEKHSLTLS